MPTADSLTVLLVEDSRVLAGQLTEALQQIAGVSLIGTVDTEAAAVEFIRLRSVNVIVLDLHLRVGTGFGVMRSLTAIQPKPQIIVLTNYDLPEYKTAALRLGATFFLDKLHDCERLPSLLYKMWRSRQLLH